MATKREKRTTPMRRQPVTYQPFDENDPFPMNMSCTHEGLVDAFMCGVDGEGEPYRRVIYVDGPGWMVYMVDKGIWEARDKEYIGGMVLSFAKKIRERVSKLCKEKEAAFQAEHPNNGQEVSGLSEQNANVWGFLRHTIRNQKEVNGVVNILMKRLLYDLDMAAKLFDGQKNKIAFTNCVLVIDYATGKNHTEPHSHKHYLTRRIPHRFWPDAKCPRWEEGLKKVYVNPDGTPDLETIKFLQTLYGYALSGIRREQVVVFLEGKGRNGKTEGIETIQKALGRDASGMTRQTIAAELLCNKSTSTFGTHLAQLPGSRLVFSDEIPADAQLNDNSFKAVTCDEAEVVAKYKNPWTAQFMFTLFVATNHVPQIRDLSEGTARRLICIPHNARFARRSDDTISGAVKAQVTHDMIGNYSDFIVQHEAEGVVNWVVKGMLRYLKDGELKKPASVIKATQLKLDTAEEGTPVEWCKQAFPSEEGAFTPNSDAYKAYRAWWVAENGHDKHVWGRTRFKNLLVDHGLKYAKREVPGSKKRVWGWVDRQLSKTSELETILALSGLQSQDTLVEN